MRGIKQSISQSIFFHIIQYLVAMLPRHEVYDAGTASLSLDETRRFSAAARLGVSSFEKYAGIPTRRNETNRHSPVHPFFPRAYVSRVSLTVLPHQHTQPPTLVTHDMVCNKTAHNFRKHQADKEPSP